ncbi:MAG TPA: trypsin-like peptidase domain-containing protein [Planctomycetota bacterium]|nr:trypsin-like peptidase domain-containing protein [Planctomycetota bacterium]
MLPRAFLLLGLASLSAVAQTPTREEQALKARITPEVMVVKEASPAVVYIVSSGRTTVGYDIFNRPVQQMGSSAGTGVMVDEEGFLVTNYHVVENANGREGGKLEVQFDSSVDPKTYEAQLVSYVPEEDLALLKISGDRKFPTVKMGTSVDLLIGERVIAIGNPFQQKLSVSSGIISGLHRQLDVPKSNLKFNDLIQTDASINHGNSGGPLLNINAELIGINTVVKEGAENMGFAIPVDRVRDVLLNKLFAPEWAPAWLGFELGPPPSMTVAQVRAGSPAGDAGIAVGDTLLSIDGLPLLPARLSGEPLDEALAAKTAREEYTKRSLALLPEVAVTLRLASASGQRDVTLSGWRRVDGVLYDRLGLTARAVTVIPGMMLQIDRIAPDGPAAAIGLAVGDVIDAVRVESAPRSYTLSAPDMLAQLVRPLQAQTTLAIDVLRDEDHDRRLEQGELFKGRLTLR